MKLEENKFISKFYTITQKTRQTIKNFTLTEKLFFTVFSTILLLSIFSVLIKVNYKYMVEIPQRGGTLEEGLIGTPRFINPVIAISDTDRDIVSLVYSGLLKVDQNGKLVNNLAESYEIGDDGLKYTIKIRDDAFFHDGKPVTSDDVIFTITKTQDPAIKSPKRPNWDGVLIEKIDDKRISFGLNQPYSPFAYNLTLGVLPKHIWQDVSSEEFAFSKYNLEPIGSGPYVVSKTDRDSNDIVQKYILKSYKFYTLEQPYINKIILHFFKNEEELLKAVNKKDVSSFHSLSPQNIDKLEFKNLEINTIPFSRVFALYLNQARSEILSDKTVRNVLNKVAPRTEIVTNVLKNYAKEIQSPVPNSNLENLEKISTADAQKILFENGWSLNEQGLLEKKEKDISLKLSFTITTANVPELVDVAENLVTKYKELGADVNLKIFEQNDLILNVIRPRDFESILFGQVINRDMDMYAFWHSSQRNDPGLNIAGFTNIETDIALEKIRTTSYENIRQEALQKFEKEVINDVPAIFLYSPDFIYIVPENLKIKKPTSIVTSSDRFADIEKWYIDTDLVWKIFAK